MLARILAARVAAELGDDGGAVGTDTLRLFPLRYMARIPLASSL
ncbi:MAG: hypothetical protein AB1586_29820 [Pseudomonadota bacterium]